ncbi:MAG: hypothetical protein WBL11_04235 [Bacteroidales bacterium]|nr:hypothetical protein [Bacteroidales bacterium]HHW58635.1 hypothetical protein [Bacteroidales bacterium]
MEYYIVHNENNPQYIVRAIHLLPNNIMIVQCKNHKLKISLIMYRAVSMLPDISQKVGMLFIYPTTNIISK